LDKEGKIVAKTEQGRLVFFDRKVKAPEQEAPKKVKKAKEEDIKDEKPKSDDESKTDKGDITVVFGRFNPPTIGHQKLLDKAKKAAGKGTLRIYPSRSQDAKKNPLDTDTKYDVMQKMFPGHADNMVNDPESKTIFDVLKKAYGDGYSNVNIVVGGDRVKEFDKLATEYNGKLYNFNSVKTISAGNRDADAEGIEGMSASKMRKAAAENDFETFSKGVPKSLDDKTVKQLFNTVKKQMKIKEGWSMWEIAPKFDWQNLRENYVTGKIFNVNQIVENLNTGLVGKVIRRGTNYLICVTEDGMMFKSWIRDITEKKKVKRASETGIYGVSADQREVGTSAQRRYAQSMVPGQEEIINFDIKEFLNKYRKKRS
jgi:phosphopantetheine adenylyltransferase